MTDERRNIDWSSRKELEHFVTQLREQHDDGRAWPQVVLLTGETSVGKWELAHAAAALYVCETSSACGHCAGCISVARQMHNDLLVIDNGDDMIKLEDARRMQEHLAYHPEDAAGHLPNARVCLLRNIENMNDQTANRLLKTLEEPPPYARIIMTSARPKSLLPTILSRCAQHHLRQPAESRDMASLMATGEEETLLKALMVASPVEAVELVERLVKEHAYTPAKFCQRVELALNEYYRSHACAPKDTATAARRRTLRDLRHLAQRRSVALNPTLSLESWALA